MITMRFARWLPGLLFALLLPTGASAGVATAGAVLLDPFDPVPGIQFQHYGGYGCYDRCGGTAGYDGCGRGCGRHHRRHHHDDCDDGCRRADNCDDACRHHDRDRDDDSDRDGGPERTGYTPPSPPLCTEGRCSDTEHWEHHWRQGDRVGQEWYDRGYRQRDLHDGHAPRWYGRGRDWKDDDDDDGDAPPAAAAAPPAAAPPAAH